MNLSGNSATLLACIVWFRAVVLTVLAAWMTAFTPLYAQQGADAPVVTTVKQIRAKNQANLPVVVRGVVTAADVVRFYVQDETGAIGVIRANIFEKIAPGDVLEVKGTTTGLGSGLGMNGTSVTKTGSAPLPKPEVLKADRLEGGAAMHQRARVSGTIHEVGVSSGMNIVQVQSSGTSFMAMWPGGPSGGQQVLTPRTDLLDAVVEIEGAAVPLYSNAGYMNGFRLVLASEAHLKVLRPGSADPFSRPVRTLRSLRDSKEPENERVLVKGVVSFWSEAGWFHFQDETDVARADNVDFMPQASGWLYRPGRSEPKLKPGDQIELVGLPTPNRKGLPGFRRIEWRVVGQGAAPPLEPVSATEIAKGNLDGRSVSVTGTVMDIEVTTDYQGYVLHTLWMEADGANFSALVQKRRRGQVPAKAGDYVRLSGVVTSSPSIIGRRSAFRLNLNQFTDIRPAPPPPVWQNVIVIRWLVAGAALVLLAFVWIFILRKQVAAQTSQLRENARQLQAQLEQEKELSEMKSRFVFTVSHEFRNPLAAIMSCSDVLQRMREQITPEEHDLQIGGIQQSVRRMADMMEEVLLLGRAEAGRLPCEPEPVDLSIFCLKLADQISSASNGRCPIELNVPPDLPRLMLDSSLLQHILGNLISNAVKYSPPGLSVEVSARPEPGGVVITIRDHGMGVPTVDRSRIFEPFHRGSNAGGTAGTGLGLAIAERCAQAHGGGISCESDAGEGTTFTVRLPCTAETPSS